MNNLQVYETITSIIKKKVISFAVKQSQGILWYHCLTGSSHNANHLLMSRTKILL